jgi:hypothetical protein
MSTGQRVQFTARAEVTTTIVAHPSGILEITRHSEHHGLRKLFGDAKDINGHSDAEVIIYLLAKERGLLPRFIERASTAHSFKHGFGAEGQQFFSTVMNADPTLPPKDAPEGMAFTPIVIENQVARAAREDEQAIGYVVVPANATLRVSVNEAVESSGSALPDTRTRKLDSLRIAAVMYANAIGVPTSRDGIDLAVEDIVAEIFSRVTAGGEAVAADILPGRQTLLAKWRDTDGAPAVVIDDVLGACHRALALRMARENFLRHHFRGMMGQASELLVKAALPPDGEDRAEWLANRDTLLESIQWIDADLGSKSYHPSHDAEAAFDALHNGLGFKHGTVVLTLADLAEMAIGRIRKAAQPAKDEPNDVGGASKPSAPHAGTAQSNSNRFGETEVEFVAGGPQRPNWHSGTRPPGHF